MIVLYAMEEHQQVNATTQEVLSTVCAIPPKISHVEASLESDIKHSFAYQATNIGLEICFTTCITYPLCSYLYSQCGCQKFPLNSHCPHLGHVMQCSNITWLALLGDSDSMHNNLVKAPTIFAL